MPEIKIGDRLVGDDHPTYVIAEIGVNHNGILNYALRLIDAAVDAAVGEGFLLETDAALIRSRARSTDKLPF